MSASNLIRYIEIDNEGRLHYKTKRQTRWHPFSNSQHPFLSSDIPEAPVYGVYISQPVGYSRACAQYSDFLDRAQLLTQKLLKQGYVAPKLKLSLQQLCGRHHNLVDHYEISISQMTMDLLLFNVDVFFHLSDLKVIWVTQWVSCKRQELLILHLVYRMLPVSLYCFCFVFLHLVYPMLPVSLDCFCLVFLHLVYPMLPVSLDCFCLVFHHLV